jgi:hypothetical protein
MIAIMHLFLTLKKLWKNLLRKLKMDYEKVSKEPSSSSQDWTLLDRYLPQALVPERVVNEQVNAVAGVYSDRFTYDEWRSLINDLEHCKLFKLKVKSSPGDILKRVYVIESDNPDLLYRFTNRITIVLSDKVVAMDVMSEKNKFIDEFISCLIHDPLEKMPLLINDSRELIKIVANWRLKNGI